MLTLLEIPCPAQVTHRAAGTKHSVAYGSQELTQVLSSSSMLPSHTLTLTLSNNKISKMNNGSCSQLLCTRRYLLQ